MKHAIKFIYFPISWPIIANMLKMKKKNVLKYFSQYKIYTFFAFLEGVKKVVGLFTSSVSEFLALAVHKAKTDVNSTSTNSASSRRFT